MPRLPILRRDLSLTGAALLGLGAMIGTGIYVSLGFAAEVSGPLVLVAVLVAGMLAMANALNSAQLAAAHPVSGGACEYGHVYLGPAWGYTAGWTFLTAKSASAAAAALSLGLYLTSFAGIDSVLAQKAVAVAIVGGMTYLAWRGLRLATRANLILVTLTISALAAFVIGGLPDAMRGADAHLSLAHLREVTGGRPWLLALAEAAALTFVAYTGYGRIATLGEEVKNPRRTIPRAIVLTTSLVIALYFSVALIAVSAVGGEQYGALSRERAGLAAVAAEFRAPGVATWVLIGALVALPAVILNLVLGLSRVVLALARHGDVPASLARIHERDSSPRAAVLLTGLMILALVLLLDTRVAWGLSAFTVLVYYGISNLSVLRMPRDRRLYPVWLPWAGAAGCAALAFALDPLSIAGGMLLVGGGWIWRWWWR